MKPNKFLILSLMVSILNFGCVYGFRYDGSYKGKIVDELTNNPIEGVVVLGLWYKETATVAGTTSTFYDAKETVTDKNGKFEIPGQGLRILTDLTPMNFRAFKAGYSYEQGPWDALKEGYRSKQRIKWGKGITCHSD